MSALAVLFLGLFAQPASPQAVTFKARLSPVPVESSTASKITGSGSVSATLEGSTLVIRGTFEGMKSPATIGGSPVSIHLYVEDVDAVVGRAVSAGAGLTRPVADQFYGDRVGGITDPFGHVWHIATHKEDLTSAEIHRRAAAQGH